ncbi:MAG: PAS domain S-box protein, partial [Fibrobacteres bacterium]|nr:PAS domain S-box protein [Fibrobacterota bacterium]
GEIKDANISACQYYGWSYSELCGKNLSEINTLSKEAIKTELEIAAKESQNHFYFKHRLASGDIRDVEIFTSFYKSDDLKLILSIIHDITAQKQAEEVVRQNEARFRSFIEQAPIPIGVWKLEGTCLYANRKYLETLGMNSIEEIVGRPATDFFASQFREESKERTRRRMQGLPVATEYESVALRADGTHFPVLLSVAPIQLSDKTVSIAFMTDITERKRQEAVLQESEQRYRQLFDASPDGVVLIGPDGLIVRANIAQARMYGYDTPEDLHGIYAPQLVAPSCRDYSAQIMQRRLNGEEILPIEYVVLRKDGTTFRAEISATILRNGDRTVSGYICVTHDITSQIQANEALRESEEKLRALFDNSKDAIGISKDGIAVMVNNAYLEMFGYANMDEITGKSLLNQLSPKEHDRIKSYITLRNAGQDAPKCYEAIGIRKNGTEFPLELNVGAFVLHGEMFSVGNIRDISERKRTEEMLKESSDRLELATASAQLGIWDWDIANNKMLWNDQMFRLYGIAEKPASYGVEIWKSGLHPDDIAYAWEACQAAIQDDKKYDIEFRVKHSSGAVRIIKADGVVLRGNSGQAVRMLGINRDITDHKTLEQERMKYEQQLQQSQKLESLGVLAGGIAHDFNNILSMIFGYVEMAIRKSNEDTVKNALNKSLTAMDRVRALTGQLLTFAKGGVPVRKIDALFPFVQETTRFALSGANVVPRFDVAQNLWSANYDQNQLGQVVDNIVINANQAMPMGGIIEITARNVVLKDKEHVALPKGNYVRISIKDYGTGIPKEMLPRIFDPFFTTKIKGHGLGLATCYSIINRHDGCIDIDSELGKGSTFHIYLPAADGSILPTQKNGARLGKGSGTFLVMDDEENILEITKDMLEFLGYTVICKTDGRAIVDFIAGELKANRSIAGIILDITIPGGMGGKEAVKEIRKLCPETPLFVASGYAEDPVMANPKEHGFTASICKPFNMNGLTEMLGERLTN